MAKNLEKKLSKQLQGVAWATKNFAKGAPPPEGETWEDNIEEKCDRVAKTVAKMSDYEEDDEEPIDPGEPYTPPYTKEERDAVLAMPVYDECRIHYMALPGYIYRNLKTDPERTRNKVYELVRQARIAGCKYVRTFLINGSRAPTERYIMDAIPWEMSSVDGTRKIDYTKRNDYYFECCGVIEEACKYWKVHHQPTFFMDRYNYDVFDSRFNVNGVRGYRSLEALDVKCQFIYDYMEFQHNYRPADYKHCWEIENEPFHNQDHTLGLIIGHQNLKMFRAAERHGTRIHETMTCSGTSEFSHVELIEENCETFSRCVGSDEFKDRDVKPEWHSTSTLDSLLATEFMHGVGSGWRHLCNNEDGADAGSYNPIPWTSFKQGNYDELCEMINFAITATRSRGKRWIFTFFAMDCLEIDPDDGIAKETYNLSRMYWHRYHAYRDTRQDLDANL